MICSCRTSSLRIFVQSLTELRLSEARPFAPAGVTRSARHQIRTRHYHSHSIPRFSALPSSPIVSAQAPAFTSLPLRSQLWPSSAAFVPGSKPYSSDAPARAYQSNDVADDKPRDSGGNPAVTAENDFPSQAQQGSNIQYHTHTTTDIERESVSAPVDSASIPRASAFSEEPHIGGLDHPDAEPSNLTFHHMPQSRPRSWKSKDDEESYRGANKLKRMKIGKTGPGESLPNKPFKGKHDKKQPYKKDDENTEKADPSPFRKYVDRREPWMIQKEALKAKFPEGWNPRKRLSPDALDGIRALHSQFPEEFTTESLAKQFEVDPEAIRRILKSKWRPNAVEEEDRQDRWFNRGKQVWQRMAALGKKPPKRWRQEGIVRDPSWHEWRKRTIERAERERKEGGGGGGGGGKGPDRGPAAAPRGSAASRLSGNFV